jgi:hypothetical protein
MILQVFGYNISVALKLKQFFFFKLKLVTGEKTIINSVIEQENVVFKKTG